MVPFGESCYALGKIVSHYLTPEEITTILSSGFSIDNTSTVEVQKFDRLMFNNVIYSSSGYTRSQSRNNNICIVRLDDGSIYFGWIKSFYILPQNLVPLCFMQIMITTGNSPLSSLRPPRNSSIRDMNTCERLSNQVIQIDIDSSTSILAIPVTCIMKKCLMISVPIHGQPISHYMIPLPNVYEIH